MLLLIHVDLANLFNYKGVEEVPDSWLCGRSMQIDGFNLPWKIDI